MGRELRSGRELPRAEIFKLRRAVERLEEEARGLSANDTRDSLNEAVQDALKGVGDGYVLDFDESNVYYRVWATNGDDDDVFSQGYTLASDGMATLDGNPRQVRPRTSWTPVVDPDEEGETAAPAPTASRSLQTARALLEALDL
jgi:hypothetical protein